MSTFATHIIAMSFGACFGFLVAALARVAKGD